MSPPDRLWSFRAEFRLFCRCCEHNRYSDHCMYRKKMRKYRQAPTTDLVKPFASCERWYVEGFAERSGIQVSLQLDSELPRLPQEVETTIFRIVQESLTNIHRHSGSKNASLRIDHDSQNTRVEIRDEGKGISQFNSAKNMPARVGVGIQRMQERVRQLQGKFEIKSGQTGTTLIVTLPNRALSGSISGSSKAGKPTSQTRNR